MNTITKETVWHIYARPSKRISFELYHMPERTKKENCYGIIKLPFGNGINLLLSKVLKITDFTSRICQEIESKEEFDKIQEWCEARKSYIYMLSCMTCAAALCINKKDPETPTEFGQLVSMVKNRENKEITGQIVGYAMKFINNHWPYKECDVVAAVPATKSYDLPREVAAGIADKMGKKDITGGFDFEGEKGKLKMVRNDRECFDKKWELLEKAKICYNGDDIDGKSVLLIDDLYQSGITMQFVAKILQDCGAKKVFGLAMKKSLGDKGNN